MQVVSTKNDSRTFKAGQHSKRPPLLDEGPEFSAPGKMSRMMGVLERLGCPTDGRGYNPLLGDKELAVAAMQSYVNIHGFFPSRNQLNGQGLGVLRQVMQVHGGMGKIKGLVSLNGKEISLPVPKPKAAKPPAPNPKAKAAVSAPNPKTEAKKEAVPDILPSKKPELFSEKEFVLLDAELPPRDFRRVMNFLNLTFESRMSREGDNNDAYFALAKELKIPVDAIGKKLFFRKCDVPALLLAATLETGTTGMVENEIDALHKEILPLKKKDLPKIGMKLWAAREFWLNKQKSPNFSEAAYNQLMHIVQLKRVTDFFAESHPEFCTLGEAPKLRRHSNLLSA